MSVFTLEKYTRLEIDPLHKIGRPGCVLTPSRGEGSRLGLRRKPSRGPGCRAGRSAQGRWTVPASQTLRRPEAPGQSVVRHPLRAPAGDLKATASPSATTLSVPSGQCVAGSKGDWSEPRTWPQTHRADSGGPAGTRAAGTRRSPAEGPQPRGQGLTGTPGLQPARQQGRDARLPRTGSRSGDPAAQVVPASSLMRVPAPPRWGSLRPAPGQHPRLGWPG